MGEPSLTSEGSTDDKTSVATGNLDTRMGKRSSTDHASLSSGLKSRKLAVLHLGYLVAL